MAQDVVNIVSADASGGVNSITYNIVTDALLAGAGCLDYEGLARVEIHLASSNNRGAATKVADAYVSAQGVQRTVPVVGLGVTRYAWFRAVTMAGNAGDWFPSSPTGGIAETTSNQVPPDNSVGTPQIADSAVTTAKIGDAQITTAKIGNAQITNAKITDLSADKLTAGEITASITITGPTIRTSVSGVRAEMSPTGSFLVYSSLGQIGSFSGVSAGFTVLQIDKTNVGGPVSSFVTSYDSIASDFRNNNAGSSSITAQFINTQSGGGILRVGYSSAAGGYAAYAASGAYGPFTGAHDGFIAKMDEGSIGEIVISTGRVIARGTGIDNTVLQLRRAESRGDRRVFGVITQRGIFTGSEDIAALPLRRFGGMGTVHRYLATKFDRLTVNGLGEGQILVCGRGGDIDNGDLIWASDMPGKGERVPPDTQMTAGLLGAIVAKATESVAFTDPDQVKLVACTYHVS
ncbi:MAG: hypothetical protein M9944_08080 [Rhizobiaceae bacterium]|nr:hypothetical protein [Rhizobiaceae bacterium]